jgi:hypothetical protein
MLRLRVKERRNNLRKESRFFRDSFVENSGVNFSFNRKVTKEIPHVLVAGAKTSLFAKIYTSLLRLLTVDTFQNFLTLIVRLLPTHYAMCGEDAGMQKMQKC